MIPIGTTPPAIARVSIATPARRSAHLILLAAAACASAGDDPDIDQAVCHPAPPTRPLPDAIDESSGAAVSRTHQDIIWTHNDSGGEPELFAVDRAGELVGRVTVAGADNVDWEDIALAPCGTGDCIYIADIGDNQANRSTVDLYRLPEPAPSDDSVTAERFTIRYPDTPHDAEALFVLPEERVHIVTKGGTGPVALYRYPGPLRSDKVVQLEQVRVLSSETAPLPDRVTGADADPTGAWVILRTYAALLIYGAVELFESPAPVPANVPLGAISSGQGEGVAFGPEGVVVLTSERISDLLPGSLTLLHCTMPGGLTSTPPQVSEPFSGPPIALK